MPQIEAHGAMDPFATVVQSADSLSSSRRYRVQSPYILKHDVGVQPITGAMADELVELCSHPTKGDLFRLEGSGDQRHAVVTSARGNEHHLEKVSAQRLSARAAGAV